MKSYTVLFLPDCWRDLFTIINSVCTLPVLTKGYANFGMEMVWRLSTGTNHNFLEKCLQSAMIPSPKRHLNIFYIFLDRLCNWKHIVGFPQIWTAKVEIHFKITCVDTWNGCNWFKVITRYRATLIDSVRNDCDMYDLSSDSSDHSQSWVHDRLSVFFWINAYKHL